MFDLVIIGAGWAGFNAALRAKALGLKTALIEKALIGGTCLNKGCIPTKTLIQSAKIYSLVRKSKTFGVSLASGANINFLEMQSRKENILSHLRRGMESQLAGIDRVQAEARLLGSEVLEADGKEIRSRFILIASGAKPVGLKGLEFDGKKILSSDEMLMLQEIPSTLLIIGGGVIGCEFASLFCALGTQVTVAELMPQVLPGVDRDAAKKLENIFKKRGITVMTGADATKLDLNRYNLVLVSIGRKSALEGLGLENTGILVEKNRIVTDDFLNAGVPTLYAAGDCTAEIMLAHFAGYQGRSAVDNMFCPDAIHRISNVNIPSCVFTDPEIGFIGLSEEEAGARGFSVEVNKFDFLGSGMARILDETDGFIKIISDSKTGKIHGVFIIGPKATELIAVITVAMQSGLTVSTVKEMIFAHPTLSEAVGEAFAKCKV